MYPLRQATNVTVAKNKCKAAIQWVIFW